MQSSVCSVGDDGLGNFLADVTRGEIRTALLERSYPDLCEHHFPCTHELSFRSPLARFLAVCFHSQRPRGRRGPQSRSASRDGDLVKKRRLALRDPPAATSGNLCPNTRQSLPDSRRRAIR
eukprot:5613711-Pleurochrysis_carterae.AAC.4